VEDGGRDGGVTSRTARQRQGRGRRNLFGKHGTLKGLFERVPLKSSGNEGFTSARRKDGVKKKKKEAEAVGRKV